MTEHRPREYVTEDLGRECLICGRGITGIGRYLRHVGEAIPLPQVRDPATYRRAVDVVTEALSTMWTDRLTDRERAQIAAKALSDEGLLVAPGRGRRSSSAA